MTVAKPDAGWPGGDGREQRGDEQRAAHRAYIGATRSS
jgi:hypothetical protein